MGSWTSSGCHSLQFVIKSDFGIGISNNVLTEASSSGILASSDLILLVNFVFPDHPSLCSTRRRRDL